MQGWHANSIFFLKRYPTYIYRRSIHLKEILKICLKNIKLKVCQMISLLVTHKSVLIPFSCIVNTYFSEPMDILNFCIESINKLEDLRQKEETFKIDLNNSGLNSGLHGLTQRTPTQSTYSLSSVSWISREG